jgi:hypothetical protein
VTPQGNTTHTYIHTYIHTYTDYHLASRLRLGSDSHQHIVRRHLFADHSDVPCERLTSEHAHAPTALPRNGQTDTTEYLYIGVCRVCRVRHFFKHGWTDQKYRRVYGAQTDRQRTDGWTCYFLHMHRIKTDRQIHRQTDRQRRYIDRQTDRYIDRQTDRQTEAIPGRSSCSEIYCSAITRRLILSTCAGILIMSAYTYIHTYIYIMYTQIYMVCIQVVCI